MKSPLSIYEELATPPIFMVEYWTFQFQRRWWRHVYFPLSVGFWREQEEARGQLFYKIAEKKVVGCEVKRNKKETEIHGARLGTIINGKKTTWNAVIAHVDFISAFSSHPQTNRVTCLNFSEII
jgi:hypothetical protein